MDRDFAFRLNASGGTGQRVRRLDRPPHAHATNKGSSSSPQLLAGATQRPRRATPPPNERPPCARCAAIAVGPIATMGACGSSSKYQIAVMGEGERGAPPPEWLGKNGAMLPNAVAWEPPTVGGGGKGARPKAADVRDLFPNPQLNVQHGVKAFEPPLAM